MTSGWPLHQALGTLRHPCYCWNAFLLLLWCRKEWHWGQGRAGKAAGMRQPCSWNHLKAWKHPRFLNYSFYQSSVLKQQTFGCGCLCSALLAVKRPVQSVLTGCCQIEEVETQHLLIWDCIWGNSLLVFPLRCPWNTHLGNSWALYSCNYF